MFVMEIKIIAKTPDFLKTCWTAARTCYSSDSPIELINQDKTDEERLKLIDRILKSKHLSVMEHASFTFAVKNVSRTLLAQYSRHRIGVSLSVQSQRYCSERSDRQPNGIFDFIVPPSIEKVPEAKEKYLETMQTIQDAYDALLDYKVPQQDARFVLPGGACTNFTTTFNLRSFFDMYEKRVIVPGAQWEIKNLMIMMRDELVKVEPWLAPYLPKE